MGWKFKDPDAVFNHFYDTVCDGMGPTQGAYEEDDIAHGKCFRSPGSLGMKAVSSRISALRKYDNALNYDKVGENKKTPQVNLSTHRQNWNNVDDAEMKADDLQERAANVIDKREEPSSGRAIYGAIAGRTEEEMDKHKK